MKTLEYKQENIERVLDAVLELAEEIGIDALNKTNIAEKVGLSTKSIQRYFDGKADIIFKVSERLLNKNYNGLMKKYYDGCTDETTGIERFIWLIKCHNHYYLKNCKELIFIQDADFYCRFNLNKPDKYIREFKDTKNLMHGIECVLERGIKDCSIKEGIISADLITLSCASIVEHLAGDVHCGLITVDEAIRKNDAWLDQIVRAIRV